jgi:hypothetical protein
MGAQLDFSKNPSGHVGVSEAAVQAYYDYTNDEYDWQNLHHTDKGEIITTMEVIKAKEYWTEIDGKNYVSAFAPARNRVFNENQNYLDPLPSGVTLINPNLGQNPGW